MPFSHKIKIGNFTISDTSRAFIIAEAGVNHNGDMAVAKKLIDCAVDVGADAVKFQAFKSEHLILKNVKKAPYQTRRTSNRESQFDMLKKLELTLAQNRGLKDYCHKKGIIFLTTPFDEYSLGELDSLNLPAYKIASTDITNLPFLRKVAQKQKPIFLSTGMACLSEVKEALKQINLYNRDVILLQCTANYPAPDNEINLRVIQTYQNTFNALVGYSDHSSGVGVGPYAIALGAKVIEKHFTINKKSEGPDQAASLDPKQFRKFIQEIKRVEQWLGSSQKELTQSEIGTRKALQKCLVAARPIKKGEIFSEDNLSAKRTGGCGISPILFLSLEGKASIKDYKKDEIIMEQA